MLITILVVLLQYINGEVHVQHFSEKVLRFCTDFAEMLYSNKQVSTIVIVSLYGYRVIDHSEFDMLQEHSPGQFRNDMLINLLIMKLKNSAVACRITEAFHNNAYLPVLGILWKKYSKNFLFIIFVICRSAKEYVHGEVHEENAEANVLHV